MQTRIDSTTSFNAKFKPVIKITNPERYANIKRLFEEGTKSFPNSTLFIANGSESDVISLSIAKTLRQHNASENVFTGSFERQMETLSDEEIAEKFIILFNHLQQAEKLKPIVSNIKSSISKAETMLKVYSAKTKCLKEAGNTKFADIYANIANRKRATIKSLEKKLNSVLKNFRAETKSIKRKYPDEGGLVDLADL